MNFVATYHAFPFDARGIKSKIKGHIVFPATMLPNLEVGRDLAVQAIRSQVPELASTPITIEKIQIRESVESLTLQVEEA